MLLTSFHDYRLLKEMGQRIPGSVEIINGEVFFNESIWDKVKGAFGGGRKPMPPEMQTPFANSPSQSVNTGAPAAGLQKPVMAQSLGYPSDVRSTGVSGGPYTKQDAVPGNAQGRGGISTLTHPDFKTDVQAIRSVYGALKTPQLRNMMQQWMGKIFTKIPGSRETAAGVGPEGSGMQSSAGTAGAPSWSADTGSNAVPAAEPPKWTGSDQYSVGTAGNPNWSYSTSTSPAAPPAPSQAMPLRRAAMTAR